MDGLFYLGNKHKHQYLCRADARGNFLIKNSVQIVPGVLKRKANGMKHVSPAFGLTGCFHIPK
jgi:hypothetical protein